MSYGQGYHPNELRLGLPPSELGFGIPSILTRGVQRGLVSVPNSPNGPDGDVCDIPRSNVPNELWLGLPPK